MCQSWPVTAVSDVSTLGADANALTPQLVAGYFSGVCSCRASLQFCRINIKLCVDMETQL